MRKKKNELPFADVVSALFDQRKDLFIRKNKNYGNSWIISGQILANIFRTHPVLKTAEDFTALSLIVRMLDKLVRYCNMRFTDEIDRVGESRGETSGDLGVYAIMLEALERNAKKRKRRCRATNSL
jgi:hypothetical protein